MLIGLFSFLPPARRSHDYTTKRMAWQDLLPDKLSVKGFSDTNFTNLREKIRGIREIRVGFLFCPVENGKTGLV